MPTAYDCLSPAGRLRDLLAAIEAVSPTIEDGTAQHLAFEWLFNEDTTTNACDDNGLAFKERFILATYYYNNGGDDWVNNSGWLTAAAHCTNWFGIKCDSNGMVEEIQHNENNVDGTIPSEFGALDSLSVIKLYNNKLIGSIPVELYTLASLSFLDLETNALTGKCILSARVFLVLNNMSWFSSFTFCFYLIIKSAGELFPPEMFATSNTLERFRASINTFTPGTIPTEIGNFLKLEQIWIAGTNRTGTIPDEINLMVSLENIAFSNNALTGEIPDLSALTLLRKVVMFDNKLTGTLPAELGNFTGLTDFSFAENELTGTIPDSFSNLSDLEELFLHSNEFRGSIPTGFATLSNLMAFDIENNDLTGKIPGFNNTKLSFFKASNNDLSGTIPATLFELANIRNLYLSNNTLTGTIPLNYGNATELIDLYLDGNFLSGTIPNITQAQLPSITELLLNSNRLSGDVPDGLCGLRSALPEQFTVLHADCFPSVGGSDLPNNPCAVGCCTSCYPGKVESE